MRLFTTLLLALTAALTLAQGAPQTIRDPGATFMLAAPKGWVIDTKAEAHDGLPVVLYPTGSSWDKADTVMYAKLIKRKKGQAGFTGVIKDETDAFRQRARDAVIKTEQSLQTKDKKDAIVKQFTSAMGKYFDQAAYITEGNSVVIVMLSARSEEERTKAAPAFRQLVLSYYSGKAVPAKPKK